MQAAPLLLPLLLAVTAGCDALGGSPDPVSGGAATFSVVGRSPSPGASGVPVTTSIAITFDGIIDETSVGNDVIALNGVSFGGVEVDGVILRFHPAGDLIPGTRYAITLSPDLRGVNGHRLGATPAWGFKTDGASPPPDTLPPSGPRPR